VSPEEVLSLDSNKKIYTQEMGKVVEQASRGSLFYYWSTKRTQCGRIKIHCATNVETNTIYTGLSSQHPGLFRKGLFIENQSTLDSE
jgi:tRNA-specific 2-thiouridylase